MSDFFDEEENPIRLSPRIYCLQIIHTMFFKANTVDEAKTVAVAKAQKYPDGQCQLMQVPDMDDPKGTMH